MTSSSGENHSEEVLLFLFVTLALGTAITWLLSRFPIGMPYTVIVFLCGILFSVWAIKSGLEDFGKSLRQWAHISPKLLLFTFLPALLFGDAMELNVRHLQRTMFSALVLAGPGSVLGTFLLAGMDFKNTALFSIRNIPHSITRISSMTKRVSRL